MRMWNVNPKIMCTKHLLGEHVEMHMFIGSLEKGMNLQGYLDNQLIEFHNIKKRHNELVREMKRRGFRHNSIIKEANIRGGYVDRNLNLIELKRRCKKCRRMINKIYNPEK